MPAEKLTPDSIAKVSVRSSRARRTSTLPDLLFQASDSVSPVVLEGRYRQGTAASNVDQGVGVRAQSGEEDRDLPTVTISALPALSQAVGAARSIARAGQTGSVAGL